MTVFVYLLKTMVVFVTLFLLYHISIEKTTFLRFRRWYLISMLFLSFLLPWVSTMLMPKYFNPEPESAMAWIDGTIRHFTFTKWLTESSDLLNMIVVLVLGIGFALAAVKYSYTLGAMYRFLKRSHLVSKNEQYTLRTGNKGEGCFCFLKTIYLCNPSLNEQNINIILEHEKAHIQQKHYIDICLSAICDFFFWFCPVTKRFQRAWEEVLECQADRQAIRTLQIDPINYQSALYENIQYSNLTPIFNHAFGRSLVAKRLIFISQKPTKYKRMISRAVLSFVAVGIITVSLAFVDTQLFQLQKIKEIRNVGYDLHEITTGYVLDRNTEKPVINALVRGENAIAVTDSDGFFFMKTSSHLSNLKILMEPQKNIFAESNTAYYLCGRKNKRK